ncbi:MAG TPA: class I SAM-dependent methyltransferase [Thermoanaerobaculia bacterium]|jgi:SAM-dependent methyltransferase|nr:class I SAM-dependent methyltransferase [Thermoanaerobaculia bacterium]
MTACPICGAAAVFRRFASPAPVTLGPESFGSSRRTVESIGVLACRACGAGWQDPPPTPESVAAAYRGMRDDLYLAEEKTRRRSLRRSLARLERSGDGRRGRLLDVGCSAGLFAELARDAGWEVLGIEPSRWLADRARERLGDAVLCARFEDVTLAPGSFDAVCLWDVLEHVADPHAFLAQAARVLRPGGVLALNVPNLASWIARALGRRWPLLLPEHLFFFSPASLRLLFARHGIAAPKLLLHPVAFGAGFVAHRLAQHGVPGARLAEKALGAGPLRQLSLPLLMGELTAIGRKAG